MSPANRLFLVSATLLAVFCMVKASADANYLSSAVEAKVSAALAKGASDEEINKIFAENDKIEASVLDKANNTPPTVQAGAVDDVQDSTSDPKNEWFEDYKDGTVTNCEVRLMTYKREFDDETKLRNEEKAQVKEIKKMVDHLVGIKQAQTDDLDVDNHKAMMHQVLLEEKMGRPHARLTGSSGKKGVLQLINDLIAKIERDQQLHFQAWRKSCDHCTEECRKAIAKHEEQVKIAKDRVIEARVKLNRKLKEKEYVQGLLNAKLKEVSEAEWNYEQDERVRVDELTLVKVMEDKMEEYIAVNHEGKTEDAELNALSGDWTSEVELSSEQQQQMLKVIDNMTDKKLAKKSDNLVQITQALARPHQNCAAIKKLLKELQEKIAEEKAAQLAHIAKLKREVAELRKRLAALTEEVRLLRIQLENREHELQDRERELAHTKFLCARVANVVAGKPPAEMTAEEKQARTEYIELQNPKHISHSIQALADLAISTSSD